MKGKNFNKDVPRRRVIVAPLEWGLGHSTRCIPIIRCLLDYDFEVFIAAEGSSRSLLKEEFPQLTFLDLKGYRVEYSRKREGLILKMLLQVPKILLSIRNEHRRLKNTVKELGIEAVISDNRFGMHDPSIPCIYITHQLLIKTGNRITEWLAQRIHYRYINKYTECWVPDTENESSLAGELSHPAILPKTTVKYLGPLSRFERRQEPLIYDLAVIISGPEPQRSMFEELVISGIKDLKRKMILVRGLPGDHSLPPVSLPIEAHDHLPAEQLNEVILRSKMIIGRCGYTTVMDLVKLGKEAILVPTPGQTEQEYLAEYLSSKKLFYCVEQKNFGLEEAMKNAAAFAYSRAPVQQEDYKKAIDELVKKYFAVQQ